MMLCLARSACVFSRRAQTTPAVVSATFGTFSFVQTGGGGRSSNTRSIGISARCEWYPTLTQEFLLYCPLQARGIDRTGQATGLNGVCSWEHISMRHGHALEDTSCLLPNMAAYADQDVHV